MHKKRKKTEQEKTAVIIAIFLLLFSFASAVVLGHRFSLLSPNAERVVTVIITEHGFSPDTVTVQAGDGVRWVNEDREAHAPASDPHPTHEFLAGFEPNAPVPPASFWQFTFTKAGEWHYHDHLFPHRRGVIIVGPRSFVATFSDIVAFVRSFIFASKGYAVLPSGVLPPELSLLLQERDTKKQAKIVRTMAEKYGPKKALEYMNLSGLPHTGETHLLVHAIGDVAYERMGNDALKMCDESFLSACYHGVIIRALGDKGMEGVTEMVARCQSAGSIVFMQCVHAAGHGFLAWTNYKVLDALSLCDKLGELNKNLRPFNCYDGVFMENIYGVHNGAPSLNRMVKASDPFYPCDGVPEKYRLGCWADQATLMLQLFNGDLKKVAERCDQVGKDAYKEMCYHNFARHIHTLTSGRADQAFLFCKNATGRWQNFCLTVVAEEAFVIGDKTAMPYEICQRIEDKAKKACYEKLLNLIDYYTREGNISGDYCKYVLEDAWRSVCRSRFAIASGGGEEKEEIAAIKAIAEHDGVTAAYSYLQKKAHNNEIHDLHGAAHLLGRIAYEQYGEQGLGKCMPDFAFGCYHGFFEALIRKQKEKAIAFAEHACILLPLRGQVASCVHGIGHGILESKNNVHDALAACDSLAPENQLYCFDGVFMEYYANPMKKGEHIPATLADQGDLWSFCSGFAIRYQTQCVRNHMFFLLYTAKDEKDKKRFVESCEQIENNENRSQCVRTTGLFAVQTQGTVPGVKHICGLFRASLNKSACMIGSAEEFVFQRKYPDQGSRICEELQKSAQEQCHKTIKNMAALYGG